MAPGHCGNHSNSSHAAGDDRDGSVVMIHDVRRASSFDDYPPAVVSDIRDLVNDNGTRWAFFAFVTCTTRNQAHAVLGQQREVCIVCCASIVSGWLMPHRAQSRRFVVYNMTARVLSHVHAKRHALLPLYGMHKHLMLTPCPNPRQQVIFVAVCSLSTVQSMQWACAFRAASLAWDLGSMSLADGGRSFVSSSSARSQWRQIVAEVRSLAGLLVILPPHRLRCATAASSSCNVVSCFKGLWCSFNMLSVAGWFVDGKHRQRIRPQLSYSPTRAAHCCC